MNPIQSPSWPQRVWQVAQAAPNALDHLQPLALLAARIYVAMVFFRSGLTKLHDWDTTLALFQDEYHVPLLDPQLAAVLGTAGEIGLPVLLVLGLAGRFAALGLSVVNVVAVLSLAEIAEAALQGHVFWGSLLAFVAVFGPGAWSADRLLRPWLQRRAPVGGAPGRMPAGAR